MKKVLIVGAGGHGQVVADVIIQSKKKVPNLELIGFLDNDDGLRGTKVLGLKVFGDIQAYLDFEDTSVIVAIGDNSTRKSVCDTLASMKAAFYTAIHPSVNIGENVFLKPGSMICAGVVINTGSEIGKHTILNTASSIDHHNIIADYVHIAPGAHLGGEVHVDTGALVGLGSSVIPRVKVQEWSKVGAGSVVNKDVSRYTIVCGNPARKIKSLERFT